MSDAADPAGETVALLVFGREEDRFALERERTLRLSVRDRLRLADQHLLHMLSDHVTRTLAARDPFGRRRETAGSWPRSRSRNTTET